MIVRNDQGVIVKREDNPVTREQITQKLQVVGKQISELQERIAYAYQERAICTTDLAALDALSQEIPGITTPEIASEVAPAPVAAPIVDPTPAPVADTPTSIVDAPAAQVQTPPPPVQQGQ